LSESFIAAEKSETQPAIMKHARSGFHTDLRKSQAYNQWFSRKCRWLASQINLICLILGCEIGSNLSLIPPNPRQYCPVITTRTGIIGPDKDSIVKEFNIKQISEYFPEYEIEIKKTISEVSEA
jgi:hypothetical protein